MQIVTWLAADGSIYQSSQPRGPADVAIPDRPADMPSGTYNRETQQWERVYDTTTAASDLTIGEAEQLYSWANSQKDAQGNNLGGIILKILNM